MLRRLDHYLSIYSQLSDAIILRAQLLSYMLHQSSFTPLFL